MSAMSRAFSSLPQKATASVTPLLGDSSSYINTILTQDAKVEEGKAREVVQQGLVALGGVAEEKKDGGENKAVVIEDVHAWKASLMVDAGAQPVRPLSDFEDIESKL